MIEIDGSSGGGQMLRTAVGLAALVLEPIKITNIRASREKPGLKAQHLACVRLAGKFCKAKIEGDSLGSTDLTFTPSEHDFSDKRAIIGTAGSIPLVIQAIAPLLIFANRKVRVDLEGGTSGTGAPTIEYTKFVTFPNIRSLGVLPPRILVQKQGFFPKGGGMVTIEMLPSTMLRGRDLRMDSGKPGKVQGMSVTGNLPSDVVRKQISAARAPLGPLGHSADLQVSESRTDSPGSSMTMWYQKGYTVLGACGVEKVGRTAEDVGKTVGSSLSASISSGASIDSHMADQMVPFMALARGRTDVIAEKITDHVRTNISVVEAILGVKFQVDENSGAMRVDGVGLQM